MSKLGASESRAIAAASFEVALVDGKPARRVQLLKIGSNVPRDGRAPWRIDDLAHAQAIIAASDQRRGATDLMFDYDHQSEFGAKPGVGGVAPASGWIKGLSASADGIFADVDWTAAADAKLKAREYRYVSPIFGFDKVTRRVTRILSAALTNTPAFDLMAVAASSQENDVDLSKINQALGLAADAGEDLILGAIGAMKTSATAIATALGLAGDAKGEEIATAAAAAKAGLVDPTKFVPLAMFDELKGQVARHNEERATATVDGATKAGKLMPSQRQWAIDYIKKDEVGFASWLKDAPVLVKPGAEEAATGAVDQLTADEKALCSSMNWAEADFLAQKKKDAAR